MTDDNTHTSAGPSSIPSPTSTSDSDSSTEPIIIILDRNSMRNDTYDCDWAGIHYRVSTPTEGVETKRLTSIYRWDKETHEETLIAEWHREWGTGAGHKFRFLTGEDMSQEFQSVNDVYPMTWGYAWGGLTNRTFTANNGKKYTWKERMPSLNLYRDDDETKTPIAEYHSINKFINKRKAFLKVQPEALEFLDTLIVTFMFSEKKRRDALKSRGSGVGGP